MDNYYSANKQILTRGLRTQMYMMRTGVGNTKNTNRSRPKMKKKMKLSELHN